MQKNYILSERKRQVTDDNKKLWNTIVSHGDRIQIIDPTINDRNGLYIAQSIETTFRMNGYKQVIELGPKV